jgi:hypothetical protein
MGIGMAPFLLLLFFFFFGLVSEWLLIYKQIDNHLPDQLIELGQDKNAKLAKGS